MICCTKRVIDTTGLVAKEDYGGSWISHTLVTEVRRVSEARYLHSKRAASIFHTKMSSLGTSKGILEIAKFALYVSVPITLMYSFAHNSEFLQKVVRNVRSLLSHWFFSLNFHSLCEKSEAFDVDCLWHMLNLIASVVSWGSVVMFSCLWLKKLETISNLGCNWMCPRS